MPDTISPDPPAQPPLTEAVADPTLSGVVTAHNEEHNLEDCLKSLRFVDELVVQLDKCTDGSKAIAEKYADKILEGSWDLQVPRRVASLELCTGDWILELDADERVTPELAEEVRREIKGAEPGYFLIPFDNYVGERLVRHGWGGSWGVSANTRLFSRGAKTWSGTQRIHPPTQLSGKRRWLKGRIIHYTDENIGDMIQRLDKYTRRRAQDMADNGTKEGFWRNFRRLFSRFWLSYVRRKGYKEGYYGFTIALLTAIWPMLAWLRYKLEEQPARERARQADETEPSETPNP